MTLVFRRGSAYDKDKIAGLQLYTANLTGRKRYVYTCLLYTSDAADEL